MRSNKLFFLTLFLFAAAVLKAQSPVLPDSVLEKKKEEVKGMISALEYYFNVIGAERTSVGEKEVIINNSYSKLFQNAKVQVEDDLEAKRSTSTFKDVQAYLKDIDFFFQNVVFDFEINEILAQAREDGSPYYKVELVRHLQGTNLDGETVNSTQTRYIELNLDPRQKELKIVSVYTNKLSRDKQLQEWWSLLTLGWKKVFQDKLNIMEDSLSAQQLTRIASIDSLDLSGNNMVLNLEPVYQLTNLKYLKLSNTWINDLKPLRSINTLKSLDISNTSVFDLEFLKYHTQLEELNLSNCHVEDFSLLKSFQMLKKLNLSRISETDLSFISELKNLEKLDLSEAGGTASIDFSTLSQLKKLDLSNSDIVSLEGFQAMVNLKELNLELTNVASLEPLSALRQLQLLNISNTKVSDLQPLAEVKSLTRVYCDNAPITEASVEAFTQAVPRALLVRNTKELEKWWTGMSAAWKAVLGKYIDNPQPNNEDLVQLLRIDSLNLAGVGVSKLAPLSQLKRVTYLNLDDNPLSSLAGIETLERLEYLSIKNTQVADLSPLQNLGNLREIEGDNASIQDLRPLEKLAKLKYLSAENTKVTKAEVAALLAAKPEVMVIFETKELTAWWGILSEPMKRALKENVVMANQPSPKQLHELVGLESLSISGNSVTDLSELSEFYRLKELHLTRLGIKDLNSLPDFKNLEALSFTQMPVQNLLSILKFNSLKSLNFSNTPVEDLRELTTMSKLEEINCSGTNVRRLRGLESLTNLRKLDCSNTRVFRLDKLSELKKLETLICFNTSLRENDLEKLKESLPNVEIVYY